MFHNSQNTGLIRRSPISHCCHTRYDVYNSLAASVLVSDAASRAARISAGKGLRASLPLRFGWLGILCEIAKVCFDGKANIAEIDYR